MNQIQDPAHVIEDVEGHQVVVFGSPEADDVEGHRFAFALVPEDDAEDDVEGHVQPRRDLDIER